MHRLLVLAMIATVGAVSAQDTSTDDQPASEPAPATTPETVEGVSDEVLSSQDDHIEDDEGVFKPTDVVSYAQSVPFPVDI